MVKVKSIGIKKELIVLEFEAMLRDLWKRMNESVEISNWDENP